MEGTHTFYRKLSCQLVAQELPEFESNLEKMLPEFSAAGSQDDVSVAGIVDLERLKVHADAFKAAVEEYERNEKIYVLQYKQAEYERRLADAMPRKLEILRRQMETANQKFDDCKNQKQKCRSELETLRDKLENKQTDLTVAQETTGSFLQEIEDAANVFLQAICNGSRSVFQKGDDAITELKQEIDTHEKLFERLATEYDQLEAAHRKAKQDYDAYNEKYEQVKESLNDVIGALAELGCEPERDEGLPADEPSEEENDG